MERRSLSVLARPDAERFSSRGLSRLWLRLGALAHSKADALSLAAAVTGAAFAAFVFVRLALQRWSNYQTNAYDFAFFDQIIWSTSRGQWFETSFLSYSFAGQHIEPVLLLFVPAYWLGLPPTVLTVTQGVVAAAAAVPLFFFARAMRLPSWAAVVAAAAYLLNPYLLRAIAFDFHPEVMVALPAFIAAWAIATGRSKLAVLAALSCLAFKEDAVFVALALAGFMAMRRMFRPAAITAATSVVYTLIAVFVLMPLLRDGHEGDLVERYHYLHPSSGLAGTVEDALLLAPRLVAHLANPDLLWTAALFLVVSAPLALLRPWLLLPILPGLLLAIASTHPPQRSLELHYAAELVPIALIASIIAFASVGRRIPPPLFLTSLVGPALIATIVMNPLADPPMPVPDASHRLALATAIDMIPGDADVSVSAQSGLLPRLSRRTEAYEFPAAYDHADWILVDSKSFRSWQSYRENFDGRLNEVRQEYELVFASDGVELFRRIR